MNYENLGIYELRKLAREIGVKSPTSLRRAELIEKINAIESGAEQPYVNKSHVGRPTKEINFTYSKETFKEDLLNLLLTIKQNNIKQNKQIDEFLRKLRKKD